MVLKMRYYGDPILRQKCEEVKEVTEEISKFIDDLVATVDSGSNSVGLAANQVGSLWRIFVIRPEIEDASGEFVLGAPEVYINARIINPSEETELMLEGCLSLPGIYEEVERPISITVEALDRDGNPFSEEVSGFKAREIMHENDHLNGRLYIDRIDKYKRKKIENQLRQLKKKFR